MRGADLSAEVTTPSAYTVAAIGEQRFSVAALDYGIKAMTPHRMAERGITTHVLPSSSSSSELRATERRRRLPGQRPRRSGDGRRTRSNRARADSADVPVFGICFGNQILGRAFGFGTYKLGTGIGESTSRCRIVEPARSRSPPTTMASRSTLLSTRPATEFGAVEVSHVCLNDDVVEGLNAHDVQASACSTTPKPPPVRTMPHICLIGSSSCWKLQPRRRADAQAHGYPALHGHRFRSDRHRPGLRVRLLGHAGLPGLARGRASGSAWSTPTPRRS